MLKSSESIPEERKVSVLHYFRQLNGKPSRSVLSDAVSVECQREEPSQNSAVNNVTSDIDALKQCEDAFPLHSPA